MLICLLKQLSAAGKELSAPGVASDAAAQEGILEGLVLDDTHVAEARAIADVEESSIELWERLQTDKIVMADIARAFGVLIGSTTGSVASSGRALRASAVYTQLLSSKGCPVLSLFDRVVCAALLRVVKEVSALIGQQHSTKNKAEKAPNKGKRKTSRGNICADFDDYDAMDIDGSDITNEKTPAMHPETPTFDPAHLADCVSAFGAVLAKSLVLKDHSDISQAIAETLVHVCGVPNLPSNAVDASYDALMALLSPAHGHVRELSAMVFRHLTPLLLLTNAATKSSSGSTGTKSTRLAALSFVQRALRERQGCQAAAAALARHVALKSQDRADARAAAVETAAALVSYVDPIELQAFVAFTARLSRTATPSHRLMAVELAPALLQALGDAAFDIPSPEVTSTATPSPLLNPAVAALRRGRVSAAPASVPGGTPLGRPVDPGIASSSACSHRRTSMSSLEEKPGVVQFRQAPWGAVCLAIIVQRCSDKTPAVRARALHHLAAFVTSLRCSTQSDDDENGGNMEPATNDGQGVLASKVAVHGKLSCRTCAALMAASHVDLKAAAYVPGSDKTPYAVRPSSDDDRATPGSDRRTPLREAENSTPSTSARYAGLGGTRMTARTDTSSTCGSFKAVDRVLPMFSIPASLVAAASDPVAPFSADVTSLLRVARTRCGDEKGQVRKAAIQLLEALLLLQVFSSGSTTPLAPSCVDLAAVETASSDALMTVRKAAIVAAAAISSAVPESGGRLWVSAALPLIRDPESAVQDTVVNQFQELVLTPITVFSNPKANASHEVELTGLRPLLAALRRGGAACRACVSLIVSQIRAKGRLNAKQLVTGLEKLLDTCNGLSDDLMSTVGGENGMNQDARAGAWLLYAEVSSQDPSAPHWEFLETQWRAIGDMPQHSMSSLSVHGADHAAPLLKVIACAGKAFPAERASRLAHQLLQGLTSLALAPSATAAYVTALSQLIDAHKGSFLIDPETCPDGWASTVLAYCERGIAAGVGELRHVASASNEETSSTSPQLAAALFTAGEMALLGCAAPSSRIVTLVQALTSEKLTAAMPTAAQSVDVGAPATAGEGESVDVPLLVQAHAWVTLGKLCLGDEELAKKCVPLFVQELTKASSPAVRNNIMVALADLVVQYTALVDAHVPRLAACLKDPHELVRTQALGLLANLLQKDYVKWRGPLFHRFLLALVDPCQRVAHLAEYLLTDTLATKMPNLAYNHFVESLFVLNDCTVGLARLGAASADRPHDTEMTQSTSPSFSIGADSGCFSLRGADEFSRNKRDAIYRALLRHMAPEHKFATTARLCQEVLGGAVEGALPLAEPACAEVLGDALRVLASKEIKVVVRRGTCGEDNDDDAEEMKDAKAMAGAAKGRLVGQMMRKHLAEGVLPVIIELKRVMESQKHPLLGWLMAAAAAMLRDHKAEIEDILAADKQLAKEILYDIRQADVQRAAEAAEKAARQERSAGSIVPDRSTPADGASLTSHATPAVATRQAATPAAAPRPDAIRPPGTTSTTPIAAEVLSSSAKKGPVGGGARQGRSFEPAGGSTPRSCVPERSAHAPGDVPRAGGRVQGTTAGALRTGNARARTVSRLARAAGPVQDLRQQQQQRIQQQQQQQQQRYGGQEDGNGDGTSDASITEPLLVSSLPPRTEGATRLPRRSSIAAAAAAAASASDNDGKFTPVHHDIGMENAGGGAPVPEETCGSTPISVPRLKRGARGVPRAAGFMPDHREPSASTPSAAAPLSTLSKQRMAPAAAHSGAAGSHRQRLQGDENKEEEQQKQQQRIGSEEEDDHVALPFASPVAVGGGGVGRRQPTWNVSLDVVPRGGDDGDAHAQVAANGKYGTEGMETSEKGDVDGRRAPKKSTRKRKA